MIEDGKKILSFPLVFLLLICVLPACAGSGAPGDDPDWISDIFSVADEGMNAGFYVPPELDNALNISTAEMERPHIGIESMRVREMDGKSVATGNLVFLGYTWNNTYAGGKNLTTYEPGPGDVKVEFFKPYCSKAIGSASFTAIEFVENRYPLKVDLSAKASRVKIFVCGREISSQNLPIEKISLQKGDLEISNVFRSGDNFIAFNMTSDKFSGRKTPPLYVIIYTGTGNDKVLFRQTHLFEAGFDSMGHYVGPRMSISYFSDHDWTIEVYNADGEKISTGELRQPR